MFLKKKHHKIYKISRNSFPLHYYICHDIIEILSFSDNY
nr:MAG TPA: hypothetical protein [Caudoviricetes sp.]